MVNAMYTVSQKKGATLTIAITLSFLGDWILSLVTSGFCLYHHCYHSDEPDFDLLRMLLDVEWIDETFFSMPFFLHFVVQNVGNNCAKYLYSVMT